MQRSSASHPPAQSAVPATPVPVEARRIRFSHTARIVTIALVCLGILLFLWAVRDVVQPFAWAVLVAYIANPGVDWLTVHTRLPRTWCITLAFLGTWSLIIAALSWDLPIFNAQVQQLVIIVSAWIDNLSRRYVTSTQTFDLFSFTVNIQQLINQVTAGFGDLVVSFGRQSGSELEFIVVALAMFMTFNIVVVYLLLDGHALRDWFSQQIPADSRPAITRLVEQIDVVAGRALRYQLLMMGVMTAVNFIVLSVLGIHFAGVLAIIAGVLDIVPIIGPAAMMALASLVALAQGSNRFDLPQIAFVVLTAALLLAVRQIECYIMAPGSYGIGAPPHPLLVLFTLFSGGAIAGILGLVLAGPVVMTCQYVARRRQELFVTADDSAPGP